MAKKDKEIIEKVVKMERLEKAVTFDALPEPSSATNKWMTKMIQSEKNIKGSDVIPKSKIETQSVSLNWALNGGFYKGYTICLYGPEGSGKSLVSMMAAGALMQQDPDAIVVLISTEFRPPVPARLVKFGIDPRRLLIRQVNSLNDVFGWLASDESKFKNTDGTTEEGFTFMLKDGAPIKGLIIDSIKGIQGPKEQKSESVEKEIMGDLSKFLNPALRGVVETVRKYNLMTIFIQQVNMNLDQDEVKYQNKKWVIPNGQSLKHFCEDMALVERVTSKDSKIFSETMSQMRDIPVQEGHTVRVKVDKANMDSPNREAEFQIKYNTGIVNRELEVSKLGAGVGVINHPLNEKGGTINAQWQWTGPNGEHKGKWIGWDNMVEYFAENQDKQAELFKDILLKTK